MLTKLVATATHTCRHHLEPQVDEDAQECDSWMEAFSLFEMQVKLLKLSGFEYIDGGKAAGKFWMECERRDDDRLDTVAISIELDFAQLN